MSLKAISLLGALVLSLFSYKYACGQVITGYGVKAGPSFASLDFKYADSTDFDRKNRVGLDICAYMQLFPAPLHCEIELHYSQKGMTIESIRTDGAGNNLGTYTTDDRLDYLAIPVLTKLMLTNGTHAPYFFAGPRLDFFIGYDSISNQYEDFKSIGLGGDIGFGIIAGSIFNASILLEARYSHDFTFAFRNDFVKVKNHSFQVLIGFQLSAG